MNSSHQIIKEALFGMRRRAMERDNQSFQSQIQDHYMRQLQERQNQGASREQAIQGMRKEQDARFAREDAERARFDSGMAQAQAQRETAQRAQMQQGYSYSPQKPEAPRPAPLRGALSARERENDRIVQNQIAYNNQNPIEYARSQPASELQQQKAQSGQGHHTVDTAGRVRYNSPAAQTAAAPVQPQAPASPRPPATPGQPVAATNTGAQPQPPSSSLTFDQAKQNLVKMNPNLGVAGHADNTKFIDSLKSTYGDNYREQMMKDPSLLEKAYTSAFSGGNTAGGSGPQAPAASPRPPVTPGQPVAATNTGVQPATPKAPAAPNVQIPQNKTGEAFDVKDIDNLREEIVKKAVSGDPFYEGIVAELDKTAALEVALLKKAEEDYLGYLNSELKKMASSIDSAYTTEQIDEFTKSAESFKKAAELEAHLLWEGMSEELRKQGADEAFIEGMTKEAVNLGGLARLGNLGLKLFSGGNFRELGRLGKTTFQNLRSSPATQEVIRGHGKQLGAFTDAAGNVMHGAGLDKLEGSRSFNIADKFMQASPDLYVKNPKAFDALKDLRSGAAEQLTGGFAKENKGLIDRSYMDIAHEAEFGAGKARDAAKDALRSIRKGKFDPITSRMGASKDVENIVKNIHSTKPSDLRAVDKDLPDVFSTIKSHAQDIKNRGISNAPSYTRFAEPHVATGTRNTGKGAFRFSPWEGVKGAFTGGMLGSLTTPILGPLGPLAGAAIGGMYKTFGPAGALAATGGSLYAGKKMLNGLGVGGASGQSDSSGLQEDRHRIVPFMSNKATGAIGGALLSMLIAKEMGLSGMAGIAAPILGGIAGYNYLPEMMNKWKDPYGSGANRMNPFAAAYNRENPYIGEPEAPQSYSASLPPPPTQPPSPMRLGY